MNVITSLYSVNRAVWHQWLTGELPLAGMKLPVVLDELCDGIGGANILSIDMGDQEIIVLPCPSQVRENAIAMLLIEQVRTSDEGEPIEFGWKVLTWGTVPARYITEDSPSALCDALGEFTEMLKERDEAE